MRHHDIGDIGNGLGSFRVFRVDIVEESDGLHLFGGTDIIFVDDSGAGAVDERGIVLHQLEKFLVDEALGFIVLGDVQGHEIGFGENGPDVGRLDTEILDAFDGYERIETENPAFESGQAFCDKPADVAETDDANGLAGQFASHEFGLFPKAFACRGIRADDVTAIGENQGDDFFGDGIGVGARGVHDIDAAAPGVFSVDIVEACAGADNYAKIGERIDDLCGDFLGADDETMRIGICLSEIEENGFRILHHGVSSMILKKFGGGGVELGWNQNLFHGSSFQADAFLLVLDSVLLYHVRRFFPATQERTELIFVGGIIGD